MARLEEVGRDYFLTICDFLEVISSMGRMLDSFLGPKITNDLKHLYYKGHHQANKKMAYKVAYKN